MNTSVAQLLREARELEEEFRAAEEDEPNTGHPAYQSMAGFVRHTMPEYEWNWHHTVICDHLDKLLAGEIKRLMVFAPPRSGKSELVSRRFPAYALGKNAGWSLIGGSHTAGLAGEMCQDVQGIIDSPEYAEVFPNVRLHRTGGKGQEGSRRTQHLFDVVGKNGVYRAAGTRKKISGHGMNLGILDDPIGDADEAFSPTHRDRVWRWYTAAFRSRKSQDARILVTLTRWHKDDLAGRLTQKMEDDARADQWTILRFPALAEGPRGDPSRTPGDDREEGEPLWPARAGQFDLDGLAADRASMGSFQFAALMQQRPTAAEGARFQEAWFAHTWRSEGVGYRLSDGRFIPAAATWRLVIVDPAATDGKGSDWTAIVAFIICPGGEILVQDVVRERLPLEQIVPRLKAVWEMCRPLYVGIEAVGFQRFLTKEGTRLMPQADIRGIEPKGKGKLVRAFPAIARAEAGKIFLPYGGASWVRYFIEELTSFTGLGDAHDDVCLTADAVVETRRGPVEIASVAVGDEVLTREGWKPVVWSGQTNASAEVLELTLSDGRCIRGTAGHPIWTENRGWVRLDSIAYGDKIPTWNLPSQSNLPVGYSGDTRTANAVTFASITGSTTSGGRLPKAFTASSGSRSTDPSRTSAISTTLTATPSTTLSRTSNALPPLSTAAGIADVRTPCVGTWTAFVRSLRRGTRTKPILTPRAARRSRRLLRGSKRQTRSLVSSAVGRSRLSLRSELPTAPQSVLPRQGVTAASTTLFASARLVANLSPSTATRSGDSAHPVVMRRCGQRAAVYNLKVDGCPEFIANGVLVHNCDCVAYGVQQAGEPGGGGLPIVTGKPRGG